MGRSPLNVVRGQEPDDALILANQQRAHPQIHHVTERVVDLTIGRHRDGILAGEVRYCQQRRVIEAQ